MKTTTFQRCLSLLLCLLLMLELLPTGVWAREAAVDGEAQTISADRGAEEISQTVLGEVLENRDESEKHFRMDDGSFLAVDYGMPVHYTQEDGAWADIDNTLILQTVSTQALGPGGTTLPEYEAVNGEDTKTFAGNLSTGFLFSAQHGETGIRFSMLDGLTVPESEATENPIPVETEEETVPETEAETEPEETEEEPAASSEDSPISVETAPMAEESAVVETAETAPDETTAETVPETVEETEAPTAPETTAETEAPTVPEVTEPETTAATEETLPEAAVEEGAAYNRESSAAISYPNAETEDDSLLHIFSFLSKEEPTLEEQIMPEKLRTQVVYEDIFEGVDLKYLLYSYNVKETIVVKQPLAGYAFTFQLGLEGLTPELREDGSIFLTDDSGEASYFIPAPYMVDANRMDSDAVSYGLSQDKDGNWLLTVEADREWIEDPDRAFPVEIDPTLIKYAGNADSEISATYVEEGSPNTVHGGQQDLYFGYSSYGNGQGGVLAQQQIYMNFNSLPDLPQGSVVVDASLMLWQFSYSEVSCDKTTIGLYEVSGDKSSDYSSYRNWIYYMTWNKRPNYDSNNMIDYTTASKYANSLYLSWGMTELVNKWYRTGSSKRAITLVAANASSFNNSYCASIAFSAYSGSHPPILAVSYRNNTGLEPYYTYQTMDAGNAGTVYISDFSSQVTVTKDLFSYASSANPFTAQLVFNSSYFAKKADLQYDLGADLGMAMHFGSGCTYNFVQHVKKETINGVTYMRYVDGDGTIHYFAPDKERDKTVNAQNGTNKTYYYDEDGLGLKINEYYTNYYSLTDDNGNELIFVEGPLLWINDADGNRIAIHYSKNGTATGGDYLTATGARIEKITQKNKGSNEETTIATFQYKGHTLRDKEVPNYLSCITDYAGNTYEFNYEHGKLVSIAYNKTVIASYTMSRSNGWLQNELVGITDNESGYALNFTYKNHKVSSVVETANGVSGGKLEITQTDDCNTIYRDAGNDRTLNTSDDIITTYGFDYAGRTVHAYTTDANKGVLGASNAMYTGSGSTNRANNRTMHTATIGVAAQQELRNFGFESTDSTVAWTMSGTSAVAASVSSENPRTGTKALKLQGTGASGTGGASRDSNLLQANTTYIYSAYVNTSKVTAFQGKGVYLQIRDTSGNTWESPCVAYTTSSLVDNGWTRISVTFTTKVKCDHTVAIYANGIKGTAYVDDLQIEKVNSTAAGAASASESQAVSNVNLLENGNLQYWGFGWTLNSGAVFTKFQGVTSNSEYSYALQVFGSPDAENYASQTVILNQPSAQTYVLSGWGKANAVPDNVTASNLKNVEYGTARDKNKQFGLRAILTYSDGATEYHYTPFSADISTWQFTSMTIVPRRSNETVQKIQVICAYERNANVAYFDDLSLVKEPAQIMKYDDDGNLTSVTTTGLKGEGSEYKNGNLIKSVTSGNGTFTYKYEDSAHPHSATLVTNGVVTQKNEYDKVGNATTTTLSGSSGPYLKTSASYTNNGNLLASITDASGQTVSYQYGDSQSVMTGLPTKVLDAGNNATTISYTKLNQLSQKGFANGGKIQYNYGNGTLTGVTRTASGKTQSLTLGRDSFGNQTSVRVGDILLASYEYGAGNGLLQKQTYGNNASVSYTYDKLGRVLKATYSSGRSLRYTHTGDGQVYSITDDNGTSATTDDLVCYYTYDSLGRVVDSRMCRGIQTLLQSHLTYDDSSRISTQAWQMGSQSYKESYTYNETDGTLEKISSSGGGNSLAYTYDDLERLNQVSNGVYKKEYSYLDVIKNVQTSMQVGQIQYSGLLGALSGLKYEYTYDGLGNITSVKPSVGDAESYSYDTMGQLTEATLGGTEYVYTYDGAGNITTAQNGTTTNSYTYGNSSWADLLTAFNGQAIAYEGQTMAADGTVTGTPVSGNPTSYYNGSRWSFAWSEGRNLTSAASTDEEDMLNANAQYAYDAGGLRIEKTVVVEEYEWVVEHSYTATVVKPTCTQKGYTRYACSICGDSYTDQETAALGHTYESEQFEPTCTEDGYLLFTCQVCGYSYRRSTDEALGHDYEMVDLDTYHCLRCDTVDIIHDYNILEDEVAPTCEEDGYYLIACECGETTTEPIPALGHDYQFVSAWSDGSVKLKCSRCGKTKTEQGGGITEPPDVELPVEPSKPGTATEYDVEPDEDAKAVATQAAGKETYKRVLKSTTTEKHSYIYASGKLLRETITGNGATKILDFRYDQSGAPYSLTYTVGSTSTVYYYVTNLQGDVMYLVDSSGNQVAAYLYDPFGKVLSSSGTMVEINPLRYRGYYQDSETGFYYLQSRYYDPAICRFINADSYASTGQGLLNYNMFAYCYNAPVFMADFNGKYAHKELVSICFGINVERKSQTLSDYINRGMPASVRMEEERIGRIYQRALDAGAEEAVSGLKANLFWAIPILCYVGGGPVAAVTSIIVELAKGFIFGVVDNLPSIIREEQAHPALQNRRGRRW